MVFLIMKRKRYEVGKQKNKTNKKDKKRNKKQLKKETIVSGF